MAGENSYEICWEALIGMSSPQIASKAVSRVSERFDVHAWCRVSEPGVMPLRAVFRETSGVCLREAVHQVAISPGAVMLPNGTAPEGAQLLLIPRMHVPGEEKWQEFCRQTSALVDAAVAVNARSVVVHNLLRLRGPFVDQLQGILNAFKQKMETQALGELTRIFFPVGSGAPTSLKKKPRGHELSGVWIALGAPGHMTYFVINSVDPAFRYDVHVCTAPEAPVFTCLGGFYRGPGQLPLRDLCRQANDLRQVVVLPPKTGPRGSRIILTPKIRSRGDQGRAEAMSIMEGVLDALNTLGAESVVLHPFRGTRRYYKEHVQGVFDAIIARGDLGFGKLYKVEFDVAPHESAFGAHVRQVFIDRQPLGRAHGILSEPPIYSPDDEME